MPKFMSIGVAAAMGAAAAYLFDPDRGKLRRAKLSDQTRARTREAMETVRSKVEYQKGAAKGILHDIAEPLRAEGDYDDNTLLQKVRSEVIGHWPDNESIEIDITDGAVRVSGAIDNARDKKRLIRMVKDVDGVDLVEDRLSVGD
jgi:osmotically-inducible protein OsmY